MTSLFKQNIIDNLIKYDPDFIGVFGSYARNEQTPESDLDILVSFKKRLTLIDLVEIKMSLTELLNIRVDLVTQKSVHSKIKPFIDNDLIVIFDAKK